MLLFQFNNTDLTHLNIHTGTVQHHPLNRLTLTPSSTSPIYFTAPYHISLKPITSQYSIYMRIFHDVSELKFYKHFFSLQMRTMYLVH
jgi:hypothetical protein